MHIEQRLDSVRRSPVATARFQRTCRAPAGGMLNPCKPRSPLRPSASQAPTLRESAVHRGSSHWRSDLVPAAPASFISAKRPRSKTWCESSCCPERPSWRAGYCRAASGHAAIVNAARSAPYSRQFQTGSTQGIALGPFDIFWPLARRGRARWSNILELELDP